MRKRNSKRTYGGDEVKRYIGALKEYFADGVKVVAEQYGDLRRGVGEVKEILQTHSQILEDHTRILKDHTRLLEDHTRILAVIKSDIGFIKSDLKKKVDYDEFAALEKRVSLVETKLRR